MKADPSMKPTFLGMCSDFSRQLTKHDISTVTNCESLPVIRFPSLELLKHESPRIFTVEGMEIDLRKES
jgi:hypothetical protein